MMSVINNMARTHRKTGFIIFAPFFIASPEPTQLPNTLKIIAGTPTVNRTEPPTMKVTSAETLEARLTIFAFPEAVVV